MPIHLGDVVARGSRSTVHRYGHGAVLKVPDARTPEQWIQAEAIYAEAARAAGAPAPRLLGLETILGRTASVWEYVAGPSMWQVVTDRPAAIAAHGRVLAELQAQLCAITAPVVLPSQTDRLASKIRRSARTRDPGLLAALDTLEAAVAEVPGTPRLCHGDLHPGNVVMSAAGPVVVDWFDAAGGEPGADVARTALLLHTATGTRPAHVGPADAATVRALRSAWLPAAQQLLGVDDPVLDRWLAVSAVARIAEDVPHEHLLGEWTRWRASQVESRAARSGS